ncbi:MAG: hypothetical protein IPJ60_14750 [Sphingobacteriaceae bacterium]|nr:hypothetical protein [Sphingobacteriaceae bacterium]
MNKRILFLSLLVLIFSGAFSQSVEFEKDNFPGKKEELRAARKQLDIGIEFYEQGRKEFDDFRKGLMSDKTLPVSTRDYLHVGNENFKSAQSPLMDAQKFNPKNAKLNYMLGFIRFFEAPASKEALGFLSDAFRLDPETEQDLPYWLGWCHQLNVNWDEAIKYYNVYLGRLNLKPKSFAVEIEDVQKRLQNVIMEKYLVQSQKEYLLII